MEPGQPLQEIESPEFRRGYEYGRMQTCMDDHERRLSTLEARTDQTAVVAETAMDIAQDAAQEVAQAAETVEQVAEVAVAEIQEAATETETVVEAVAETAEAVAEAVSDHAPGDETEHHDESVTIIGEPEVQAAPDAPIEPPARRRRHGVYGRH